MAFVTMWEYEHTKLGSLEDRVYRRIERTFAKSLGFTVAERLMRRFANMTLREVSENSYVDILSAVTVL